MKLDRIEGKPDETVAWGSDIAAQMLRRFDIPFISLNPGASYRGFHDSLVNHLGNENPGIILCLHEDHSVAIAHGYAKATGEPMACVLHSNVGLLHGMMGIFNAWCDRAPMIIMGATGPVAAEKRRPWIDWIHTSRDQGAYIRSLVKWDDQPTSPAALVEFDGARKHVDPRCADCAGLRRARRRFPGDQTRQGTGVAGHQAPPAAKPSRPAKDTRRPDGFHPVERQEADHSVRPRLAQGRILEAAYPAGGAARRLRVHRSQAGCDVPERQSAPLRRAVQRR